MTVTIYGFSLYVNQAQVKQPIPSQQSPYLGRLLALFPICRSACSPGFFEDQYSGAMLPSYEGLRKLLQDSDK